MFDLKEIVLSLMIVVRFQAKFFNHKRYMAIRSITYKILHDYSTLEHLDRKDVNKKNSNE